MVMGDVDGGGEKGRGKEGMRGVWGVGGKSGGCLKKGNYPAL